MKSNIKEIKRIVDKNTQIPIHGDYEKGWTEACKYILSAIEKEQLPSEQKEIIEYLKAKQTIAEYERKLEDTTGGGTECITLNLAQVNKIIEITDNG